MTAEMENLVLEQLRSIGVALDNMRYDLGDLKPRMSAAEVHIGQLNIQLAGVNGRMDRFIERTDRFDERLGSIERRLELTDA